MSNIDYVMVMHDGGRATRFMPESHYDDLRRENTRVTEVAAVNAKEVLRLRHELAKMRERRDEWMREACRLGSMIASLESALDSRDRALRFVPIDAATPSPSAPPATDPAAD